METRETEDFSVLRPCLRDALSFVVLRDAHCSLGYGDMFSSTCVHVEAAGVQ